MKTRLAACFRLLALIAALAAFITGIWLLLGLILSWILAPLIYLLALVVFNIP